MTSSPIDAYLERLHERWLADDSGAPADYIPPLAEADPAWFGIAIATTDGHCYEIGESRRPFTIQSISKPFTYGLALADLGFPDVDAKVGVEPSGDAFNSISLASAFERLGESDPVLQTALMRNLLASFYEVIGRMTREVGTFFQGR